MPGSGLELGELIAWAVAGRGLKGMSVKYWLNGSLSTATVTLWRCWYTRVIQLTGFGLRSICTPMHPTWFVERPHIQFWCNCRLGFMSLARAILVLLPAEAKPGWTPWSLSCDGSEACKTRTGQGYTKLRHTVSVLWYSVGVATPTISGEYPRLLGYYAASTGKLLPMFLRSVVPPSWCCRWRHYTSPKCRYLPVDTV